MAIKLIASDMDGSLLTNDKRLPPDFFQVLEQLHQRGIRFAAASGRAYYTLRENFAPYEDRLDYLCENGAFVSCGGKVISMDALDPAVVSEIIDCCEKLPDAQLVLCGKDRAYHKQPPAEYTPHLQCYYVQHQVLTDLHQVTDPILKVAICNLKDIRATHAALEPIFGSRLNVVVSGDYWMDMMNPQVNKGWGFAADAAVSGCDQGRNHGLWGLLQRH